MSKLKKSASKFIFAVGLLLVFAAIWWVARYSFRMRLNAEKEHLESREQTQQDLDALIHRIDSVQSMDTLDG